MASNDPGFAPLSIAPAEDARKGSVVGAAVEEEEKPIAPDQFDPRYETSKMEIWSYYAYEMPHCIPQKKTRVFSDSFHVR